MGVPPPITFINMFLSAKEVFGKEMEPDFLIVWCSPFSG